jgi:acetolactate synthase-1/2/3 large subunit
MTGGELVVECLKAHGVKVIFGMPGGHTTGIYDALYGEGQIRHILVRNEQAGAFMADGYARATGEVGVCLTTAGPGATNASTGVAAAYSDSIPILLIAGQVKSDAADKEKGYYHEMDQLSFFRPITKWNASAKTVNDIPKALNKAFEMLKTGRPRPVHIEVPIDVIADRLNLEVQAIVHQEYKGKRQTPSTHLIAEASEILANSELPLIIAGGGVISADASKELIELAELLNAQVITTPMGKGAIPADHPLHAGLTWHQLTADLSGMQDMVSPLPGLSDAILAVGCRFTQLATGDWVLKVPETLIQIDIDETEIGKNYPVKVGIVADAKVALQQLIEELKRREEARGQGGKGAITLLPSCHLASFPKPKRWAMEGWDIIPILRETLKRDAIVAADITRPGYMMLANFDVYQPRTFLHSVTFIALGHGFPAALGAKVAYPERQVVAVCGDGGFMMTCQEMATAVQHGINVVVIVINDRALTAIKSLQDKHYGGRHIAINLQNPDFVKFAESFGARGLRVEKIEQFKPAMMEALNAGVPVLVEIVAAKEN